MKRMRMAQGQYTVTVYGKTKSQLLTLPRERPDEAPKQIGPPAADVQAKEDPDHTESDFLADLKRATRRVRRSS